MPNIIAIVSVPHKKCRISANENRENSQRKQVQSNSCFGGPKYKLTKLWAISDLNKRKKSFAKPKPKSHHLKWSAIIFLLSLQDQDKWLFFLKRIIKPDAKTILAALVFVQLCSYFNGELMNRSARTWGYEKVCYRQDYTNKKKTSTMNIKPDHVASPGIKFSPLAQIARNVAV